MAKLERTDKPISVLIDEINSDVLGLPEIQRSYVWHKPQVRDLLDSLYRQYPIGLILLWKPHELPELRKFDAEHGGTGSPEFLILDGQQRLTSMKKVVDGQVDVRFNVEEELFQVYNRKLDGNPLWISVKRVFDDGAVKVWRELKAAMDAAHLPTGEEKTDKYLERLSNLEKIKDYRLPVMIIHTDDYNEVTESFIRVNSKGTRLKEAELAMARLALSWPGVLVEQFEKALEEYEEVKYFFEATFLMRCYVAIATGQSRFKYLTDLWERPREELQEIWEKTKKAVDYAVNFLRNNAGIESTDWIPSLNALVPIVAFLSTKNGHLSDVETKGLLLWFFEATMHSRFASSPETKMDQDLRVISTINPIESLVDNLRRDRPDLSITEEMLLGRYQASPLLPILFVITRRKNARDWFTGTTLSSTNVGPEHQLELHHIFPKAVLKDSKKYDDDEINDIANIAFLSQKANRKILKSQPDEYLKDIETERLEAQFVPTDRNLWKVDKFRDFLSTRRKMLTAAVNGYMSEIGERFLKKA